MNTTAENLYKDYRADVTKKLVSLLTNGESVFLHAKSGMGKSKYLRYLAKSEYGLEYQIQSSIVKYIDLNQLMEKSSKELVRLLNIEVFNINSGEIADLNTSTEKLLVSKIFLILMLDHAENLNDYPEEGLRILKAYKDHFKYQVCYLLACETKYFSEPNFNDVINLTRARVELLPFNKEESIYNIKHFAKLHGLKLTNNEVERIADVTKGIPGNIKQVTMRLIAGENLDLALKEIADWKDFKTTVSNDVLNKCLMNMTKSEYLIFHELYINRGKLVTRDRLAELLNPVTDGDGVSNESIDQIISRVRKSISKMNLEFEINTKRGVGYFLT